MFFFSYLKLADKLPVYKMSRLQSHSFNFLKSEIEIFIIYFLIIYVNWEKSEAAWLGLEKTSSCLHPGCKWVNLTTHAIRILGIMFTYNTALSKHLNFVKILEKYKMCLSMWKSRQLTIYGLAKLLEHWLFQNCFMCVT